MTASPPLPPEPQPLAAPDGEDVPSPIDLRQMPDAREWASAANARRPWRMDFFERFADALASPPVPVRRLLELGSGPGFLAAHLLGRFPEIGYVALDFSPAMHQLAAERLGAQAARVQFVERSFRDGDWAEGLGRFDAVITHQAVHELRHKRHALALHAGVRQVLNPQGIYLVCDHFAGEGGMANAQLYMSVEEQRSALHAAGFTSVSLLLMKGGLALHLAQP